MLKKLGKISNKKGFTLVELIIVIVILIVIAAIAIPSVASYIDRANKGKANANAKSAYYAVCILAADKIAESGNSTMTEITQSDTSAMDELGNVLGSELSQNITAFTIDSGGNVTVFTYTEGNFTFVLNASSNTIEEKID